MGISIRKAAEILGISHTALNKAIRVGRVRPNGDGTVDVERARLDLQSRTNVRQQQRTAKHRSQEPQVESATQVHLEDANADGPSLYELQRQGAQLDVKQKELKLAEMQGRVVDVEKVAQAWKAMLSKFRNKILLMPARVAPKLIGLNDAVEVQTVMESEVDSLLKDLSETPPDE